MAKQTPEQPRFLTRADVANLLRLTSRQVDRLAANGTLNKQKLSASRSGFARDGVEAYLAKMAGRPSSAPHDETVPARERGGYASEVCWLRLEIEGDPTGVGAALESWLATHGAPGILVTCAGGHVDLIWARSLPYDPKKVERIVNRIRRTAAQ
jgi:hypothetical protein